MAEISREDAERAASLVHRVREGDPDAETELVEHYSRGVLCMLRQQTRDPELARDLHQETFRVVLERLRDRGLEEPEKLAAFLRATARNLFLSERRKRVRRKTDDDSEAVERTADSGPDLLGQMTRDRQAEAVRGLLGELHTERDRQILIRFYLAEDDKQEICDDLELSALHFNRVLHRAKSRFKKILLRERQRWDQAVARLLAMTLGVA